MHERLPDWENRLNGYLSQKSNTKYQPGRHDCLLFVAGAVKAQTGHDPGRGHRGKYRSQLGSAKYLKRLGFDSPEAMLDSLFDEKPVAFAQRGDIVLDREGVPGICIGGDALFVGMDDTREGLFRQPRSAWRKAWTI